MGPWVVFLITLFLQVWQNYAVIKGSVTMNKLAKVRPVGAPIASNFVPLTEIPPPRVRHARPKDLRRHMADPADCTQKTVNEVVEGGHVEIAGDYYEEKFMKTVATVIFPDHIDHRHFEVTTQVPYLTVGPIEAIGYHPSTVIPSECEKIYQDHVADQYSDETKDVSEESLEMARMPLFPPQGNFKHIDTEAEADMYDDISF